MPPVIRHFQIPKKGCVGDCVFAEPRPDFLYHVLQPLSPSHPLGVNEQGQLEWVILRNEVNCTDGDCTDFRSPTIAFTEQLYGSVADFRWELGLERQLALVLITKQIVASYGNLNPTSGEFVESESVADILGEGKDDLPHFFVIFKICRAGDAVTYALDGRDEVPVHHPGLVSAVCVTPESNAVDP